ncbi:WGR domain [Leminorella richardii]|uniref:WGR domain n=1 Tax=Leminorella richardii TaxID=158841 RepID=A0A2X4V487_9GAMM|nr:DUF4240 domain-containing protein [Leminorella richardii]SQI41582.1 WGR domain [Leminorella richardii]
MDITKYLIQQDGTTNKFWHIETHGHIQTIHWGRIDTKGRMAEKEFDDSESCQMDSEKLIAQKLRKGYVEAANAQAVPEKRELTEEEQGEALFWDAINRSNKWKKAHWSEYDIDEHLENLTALLAKKSKESLILFERHLQINLHRLYTAHIAELSIILENRFTIDDGAITFDDYISEDGFIYFRCWLLLKGKGFFDEISQDINAFINGKYSFNIGDSWAEGLLYVADDAYSENNDNQDNSEIRDAVGEMKDVINYDAMERVMDREPMTGSELQKAYPRLVAEIVAIR